MGREEKVWVWLGRKVNVVRLYLRLRAWGVLGVGRFGEWGWIGWSLVFCLLSDLVIGSKGGFWVGNLYSFFGFLLVELNGIVDI